jgi:hypothetical protein
MLSVGDRVASDQAAREELATNYFVDLLGTAQPMEFDLSLEAMGLPQVDLAGLEAQVSEEETWAAIRAMLANKSPGPDGFTWDFYKACLSIIKQDVLAALQAVWLGRHQGFDCLNDALITLIPKKEGVVDLKDFRPISLVHSFARLLTKILACILAPRMPELMDAN